MATIQTLTLKKILEAALKRPNTRAEAEALLKEIPLHSNYLVETSFGLFGFDRSVVQFFNLFKSSSLSIEIHISIRNLSSRCELELSQGQAAAVEWLIQKLT
jgi:hypothetical protein